MSGGRPPPASVSIEGGHSSEPGQPGGEGSQRLLVNRQHLGVNQQRGQQEATAAKEAPQGGAVGGKRSVWQPGRVCLKGPQHRAQEGEGPQDDVEAHPPPPNNKQATGTTRFSYATALEGGERVVRVSLEVKTSD